MSDNALPLIRRQTGIPFATVHMILDAVNGDLPAGLQPADDAEAAHEISQAGRLRLKSPGEIGALRAMAEAE